MFICSLLIMSGCVLLTYKKVFLPNAEKLSGSILGLPNHHKLRRKDLDYIVSVISKI